MASKPVTLKVQARGKKRISGLPCDVSIYLQGSAGTLHERIAKQTGLSIHRLRITTGEDGKPLPNDDSISVDSAGLRDGSVVLVKDLGPQIGWKTVFVIEYVGPIIIHPLFYLLRPYIYSNAPAEPSTIQSLSCALITIHFIKRVLETLFVHRFSNATMPFTNVFKNSFHYWILSGVFIAYFTYGPNSAANVPSNPALVGPAIAFWTLCELGNLNAHLVLRSLRSAGGSERGIPKGLGFDWCTCPNYFFEILGWLAFLVINRTWATAIFAAVGAGQMAVWGKKKEHRYRKEMGTRYKKKSFVMFPGVY